MQAQMSQVEVELNVNDDASVQPEEKIELVMEASKADFAAIRELARIYGTPWFEDVVRLAVQDAKAYLSREFDGVEREPGRQGAENDA